MQSKKERDPEFEQFIKDFKTIRQQNSKPDFSLCAIYDQYICQSIEYFCNWSDIVFKWQGVQPSELHLAFSGKDALQKLIIGLDNLKNGDTSYPLLEVLEFVSLHFRNLHIIQDEHITTLGRYVITFFVKVLQLEEFQKQIIADNKLNKLLIFSHLAIERMKYFKQISYNKKYVDIAKECRCILSKAAELFGKSKSSYWGLPNPKLLLKQSDIEIKRIDNLLPFGFFRGWHPEQSSHLTEQNEQYMLSQQKNAMKIVSDKLLQIQDIMSESAKLTQQTKSSSQYNNDFKQQDNIPTQTVEPSSDANPNAKDGI